MLGTLTRKKDSEVEELLAGYDRIRAVLDSLPYTAPEMMDRKHDELVTVCRQVVGKRER